MIFYSTWPVQDQGVKGIWDYDFKTVYVIGILDFIIKPWKDCKNIFEQWIWLLKNMHLLEENPFEKTDTFFHELVESCRIDIFNKEDTKEYESSLMKYAEYKNFTDFAKREGVSSEIISKVSGLGIDEIMRL
jgi:hypothetical protein